MKIKAIGVACLFIVGIVAFQNCSQVKFTPTDAASLASQSVDPTASATPDPGANPPVVDIATVADFSCKTFVDLTVVDGQTLDIPARSTDGLCYTAKIISASSFGPSSTNPHSDAEVISRNHDSGTTVNHHPYVLGSRLIRLILNGERTVKLSGGKNDTASINVDNFILVGIAPFAQIGTPSFYKAYGTVDSGVSGHDYVTFKDVNVHLTGFGGGGTSTISPLQLEGLVQIKQEYGIDVRALDAGGIGQNSDIYLLFK